MKSPYRALTLALALGTTVPAAAGPPAIAAVAATDRQWNPKDSLPPGAYAAVVRGDPHVGPYAFFGRFPAGFRVPQHWHTNEVAVVMTHGSMRILADARELQAAEGGYFLLPAGLRYVAECPQGCEFLAWGEMPFDIHYVDPSEDPRTRSGQARR